MSSNSSDRILDAAWELVRERGSADVTLADVGRAAGVSRQAVYLHFDSRAGLLTALARRQDERSGFRDRMIEAATLAPAPALERMLRLWSAYVPEIMPVARPLEAMLAGGDAGAVAWRDRMRDLRAAFRTAVRALDAAGELAPGWSVAEATDWVWARSHFSVYTALVVERGWSQRAYADRLVASVMGELVPGFNTDLAGRL